MECWMHLRVKVSFLLLSSIKQQNRIGASKFAIPFWKYICILFVSADSWVYQSPVSQTWISFWRNRSRCVWIRLHALKNSFHFFKNRLCPELAQFKIEIIMCDAIDSNYVAWVKSLSYLVHLELQQQQQRHHFNSQNVFLSHLFVMSFSTCYADAARGF